MAKYRYALEKGQPERLEIETNYSFDRGTVKLDDQLLLEICGKKTFIEGVEVPLPDGSKVLISLQPAILQPVLLVTRNGEPLPGSRGDAKTNLLISAVLIYVVAGLSAVSGILAVVLGGGFLAGSGLGWGAVIAAAVFALLGWLTQHRSKAALLSAMVLYGADGFLTVFKTVASGESPSAVGIILRVVVLIAMLPGVRAIDELRAAEQRKSK